MAGSIENKFNGITLTEHTGNSNIKIRWGLHNTDILGPKAIVECGSCGNEYKKSLMNLSTPFSLDEDLKCKCGNIDSIQYNNYNNYKN